MTRKQLLIIPALLFLGFVSCETTEKIDDFPLRPSRLVVNCFFTPDSIWEFQVSKSLSVLDNADIKLIDNAKIKLFRNSEIIDSMTEQDEDKWYRYHTHLPEVGQEYSIEVTSPDFGSVLLSQDSAPQAVQISDVDITVTDSSFYQYYDGGDYTSYWGNMEGSFDVSFSDPAMTDNYYEISIFSYDTARYDWENPSLYYLEKRRLSISSDDAAVITEGDYNNELLFTDYYFNGQNYMLSIDFEDWNAQRDKQYYIELVTLSKAGYLYRRTVEDYSRTREDPFAESVQIFCNIENGYGIFSGYSTMIFKVSDW